MNHLSDNFYRIPHLAEVVVPRKVLREILLSTGGEILACGDFWTIKSKHLGVGVYRIFLKKRQ